eukprot:1132398_1
MAFSLIAMLPWIYISIQGVITLIVSVLGVSYVRNEYLSAATNNDEKSKYSFCKLWFRIVWKMRSVYCSLAVHVFDVLTDALVIIEWWNLESDPEVDIEHVDARAMAICGIIVLLLYKTVSVIAFWAKEASFLRCLFQFLDLLIFEEIYVSHTKIVANFKNQSTKQASTQTDTKVTTSTTKHGEAVDTTTSFKFVRNLEAIFESIPQAILQLVFIIRTSGQYEGENDVLRTISIISIIQSIISMTNSILKNDNIQMNLPKWKKHKQRLPPTIPFLKHAVSRLSEVMYRIGLLALFWTVCEGLAFGILMCVELVVLIALSVWYSYEDGNRVNVDELCLRMQALIVLPSEFVYAEKGSNRAGSGFPFRGNFPLRQQLGNYRDYKYQNYIVATCLTCCCCFWPVVMMTTLCHFAEDHYIHVTFRIGISSMEWSVLIFWGLFVENRRDFLFSMNHGLVVLIISGTCFFIYSQYMFLFPKFTLPKGVAVRSNEGYAFNGELQELQRMRFPAEANTMKRELKECAMFALANGHHHIVKWLEEQALKLNTDDEGTLLTAEENTTDYARNRLDGEMSYARPPRRDRDARNRLDDEKLDKGPKIFILARTVHGKKGYAFRGELQELMRFYDDEKYMMKKEVKECAMFALANGHYHVVEWLEEQTLNLNLNTDDGETLLTAEENTIDYARNRLDGNMEGGIFVLAKGVAWRIHNKDKKKGYAFDGELQELQRMEFSDDERTRKRELKECAEFALANGHYHIVEWLEEQNTNAGKIVGAEQNIEYARQFLGGSYFDSDTEEIAWPCCSP